MKKTVVYCGSAKGNDPVYAEAVIKLARLLVQQETGLVYGGGNVGLMGIIANEVLRLGGEVIGVIPKRLMEKEAGHTGLTRLFVVNDMHERKAKMFEPGDACIALPGGIGTVTDRYRPGVVAARTQRSLQRIWGEMVVTGRVFRSQITVH